MAQLPADRTKLALAQQNQVPGQVAASVRNINAVTEAYDTIDQLYAFATSLISRGTLSRLGEINVMDYNASGSAQTTTGSIDAGTKKLVVSSAIDFSVGQGINVAGAGSAGAMLVTTVNSINGLTLTLADSATTSVSNVVVKHSDSAAVQSVINIVSAAGGGIIKAPRGTYRLTSPLVLKENITIEGDGMLWPLSDAGTIFQCEPNVSGLWTGFNDGDTGWLRNVKLSNFTVNGDKDNSTVGYGLYGANYRYNAVLDRVQFSNHKQDGINLTDNWFMALYNVRCIHNDGNGVYFPDLANNVSFYACQLNDNAVAGLSLANYECVSLFGGLVEQNLGHGIRLDGGQVFNVTGVYLELNKPYSIYIRGDDTNINYAVNVTGNRIYGNSAGNYGTSGINILSNARAVEIHGNRIEGFIDSAIKAECSTADRNVIIGANNYVNVPIEVELISPTRAFKPMIIGGTNIYHGNRSSAEFRVQRGTSAQRPASPLQAQEYYDTTLLKPIWYTGTQWRDGAGTVV